MVTLHLCKGEEAVTTLALLEGQRREGLRLMREVAVSAYAMHLLLCLAIKGRGSAASE